MKSDGETTLSKTIYTQFKCDIRCVMSTNQ